MLYGEECVSSLIRCQLCQSILKEAKILPSGLFCNNCITELTKNVDQESKEFKCKACDETHSIPKNGFKSWKCSNSFFRQFRRAKLEETYRGESADKLKKNLYKFQKKIDEFDFKLTKGIDSVKEHCLKLKNEINLEAEVAIKSIQYLREEMIGELNSYEANCVSNLELDKINQERFNGFLKTLKNFHQYWSLYLKKYQINETEMVDAINSFLEFEQKIEKEKRDLEVFLFNNKSINFNKNLIKNYLGNLDTKVINENYTKTRLKDNF